MQTVHAPALNANNLPWFNVHKPLDLPDLKGKVAILDFWTFCCINCIHIIPTLKKLESRFPKSLAVIGVHSPKFPGEKNVDNVQKAIERYEIEHPIVHDTDFSIWKQYAVRAWPTLIFISPDGYILGQLPGEPDPNMLEMTMAQLLEDFEKKGALEGNASSLLKLPEKKSSEGALKFPGKISYSTEDNEFAIADSNHNQILTANRKGEITRRIGTGDIGKKNGSFKESEFFRPQGLHYENGIIWIADTENHMIRHINIKTEIVSTSAGTGIQGPPLQGQSIATSAALSSPWDVQLVGDQVYFANAGTHQIGSLDIKQKIVSRFAGTGQEALLNGLRSEGAFAQPSGLSYGEDKLFLADSETSAIRSVRIDKAGFIATYVGTGLFDFGDKDGRGKEALLQHPLGVFYSKGKIYIADSYNNKIKMLDLKTQEVTVVQASANIVCDDINCSKLWEPAGVIEVGNSLFVSDTNNHRILKIDLITEKTEIFIN
jgi:thiol-disulfide isomerase/thioredoxin